MPQIAMPTPQRPTPGGRPRAVTQKASFSDDDEITPCSSPAPEPHRFTNDNTCNNIGGGSGSSSSSSGQSSPTRPASPAHHHHTGFSSSFRRKTSSATAMTTTTMTTTPPPPWHFDPADGEDMDDSQLWQRMLDIQRTFHCYNSARMSAALLELEMGVDVTRLAPSRSCLDLINESISDLPGEDRQRLAEWLHENPAKRKRSGIWRRSINF